MNSATIFVVLLTDILLHGDWVYAATVLEVDRGLRNDWKGSGICRDATEEEIAAALEAAGDVDDDQVLRSGELATTIAGLEGEVAVLQERKLELTGDLKALEDDLGTLDKQRNDLQTEVGDLDKQKKALGAEVNKLEAAKAAAEKPVTAAKSK